MNHNILIPKYNDDGVFIRQIRSFVCRSGRITKSQLYAIDKHWSLFGVDFQLKPLNFVSLFHNYAPIVLDIGFGSGESLANTAFNFPNKNFLGVEVYKSGIGSCLNFSYSYNIKNIKIIYHDAVEVVNNMISNNTLSIVQFFFPDPWNKKRHHKRRILKSDFLKTISNKLITNGILHIVTDSEQYAVYVLQMIKNIDNYIYLSNKNKFSFQSLSRIKTKFEKKGDLKGHKIFDLMFQKQ